MPILRWKKLSERIASANPWWEYRIDTFRLPKGTEGEYHYVYTRGASMVIPLLSDGRIVLVNQYRYLCDRESLEFPCGGVKENSDYLKTAAQELAEEAGFTARDWKLLGTFNPYNGVTNEICNVYLARGLSQVESKPDLTEEFEHVLLSPAELEARIQAGEVWDGMTLAGWTLARSVILSPGVSFLPC